MQPTDWQFVRNIFLATLPLLVCLLGILGAILWNLIDVRDIKQELVKIRERLAKIEQRLDDAHIGSNIVTATGD